jgi:hypothetical protein
MCARETYVRYRGGGTRPSANAVAGAKVFSIPLTSVSVPDTVPYAFLVRQTRCAVLHASCAVGALRGCMLSRRIQVHFSTSACYAAAGDPERD